MSVLETWPEASAGFRSGFVAVVGRPNVGKSTLINSILGQKITIVSPKPQTTRMRLLGILTLENAQIVFTDTPGIHSPLHKLGHVMVETALAALPDADVIVWVVDGSLMPSDEDRQVASVLGRAPSTMPLILAVNKSDRLPVGESGLERARAYASLAQRAEVIPVSALRGHGLGDLVEAIVSALPPGPLLFPEEQVTDQQVRFMAGELVREQALLHLRDEVPHSIAVMVEEFKERDEGVVYISAIIYVERESQKAIVLGKGGQMVREIGQSARREIEKLLEDRVYLDLWVKVRPKWRTDVEELRRLGYQVPRKAKRRGGAKRGD